MARRNWVVAVVSLAACLAAAILLTGGGSPDAPAATLTPAGAQPDPAFAPPARGAPLLGIAGAFTSRRGTVRRRHYGQLVHLRPGTLSPARRPIALRGDVWSSAWAPGGKRLALAVSSRGRVQLVDTRAWRSGRMIDLPGRGRLPALTWPSETRIVGFQIPAAGTPFVVGIDPRAGKTVWRHRVRGLPVGDPVPTANGLAVLTAPHDRIGPATLVAVDAAGRVREHALADIAAGSRLLDPQAGSAHGQAEERRPALAVDPAAHRAYVVSASLPRIVEVDLRSGATASHDLRPQRSLLARLHDAIEPAAHAKSTSGADRQAALVGDGRLAVSGSNTPRSAAGDSRVRPYGLHLVDLRAWTSREVDARAGYFLPAPGALVTTDHRRGGLTVRELDGSTRFTALARRRIDPVASAGRLYAAEHRRHTTHVIDLASGRLERRLGRSGLPRLIAPPPAGP